MLVSPPHILKRLRRVGPKHRSFKLVFLVPYMLSLRLSHARWASKGIITGIVGMNVGRELFYVFPLDARRIRTMGVLRLERWVVLSI
jgi:hypothetical protein